MGSFARTFLRLLPFLMILMVVTSFVPSVRADSVQFSFKIDLTECLYAANPVACSNDPTAGSGVFSVVTQTPTDINYLNCYSTEYRITSVVGQIDGYNMTFLPNASSSKCDNTLSLQGPPAAAFGGSSIFFMANNQEWAFDHNDMGPWTYDVHNLATSDYLPITWSTQVFVSEASTLVPEPSTLMSLAIGLFALVLVFERNMRRGRYDS